VAVGDVGLVRELLPPLVEAVEGFVASEGLVCLLPELLVLFWCPIELVEVI